MSESIPTTTFPPSSRHPPHPPDGPTPPLAHSVNESVGSGDAAEAESHSRATLDQLMPVLYEELRVAARRQLAHGPTTTVQRFPRRAWYTRRISRSRNRRTSRGATARISWRSPASRCATSSWIARKPACGTNAKARLDPSRSKSSLIADAQQPEALLQISDALERLAAEEPRLAHIVDCRFFGGFSEPEIADALGVTVRTVQRDWVKARALLRRALEGEEAGRRATQ